MTNKSARGEESPVGRVLIVDGHDGDRRTLAATLAAAEFAVDTAAGADEARRLLKTAPADAIVVDPELGGEDGLELVRRLSEEGRIVFVVARHGDDTLADRAYGSGAADFACKPVVASEWTARLRRAVRGGNGGSNGAVYGGGAHKLSLNRQERRCTVDGRSFELTRHERDFIACLLDAPGHFATYDRLIAAIWGEGKPVETQYLRVLAAQVRRKLEARDGSAPPLIHTVVGEGLKLNL